MSERILVVDDDPVQCRLLEAAVTRLGYDAVTCDGGGAALSAFDNPGRPFAAALIDLVMPDVDGLTVMRLLRERDIETPVIALTAQGGIDVVINAMRAGAFDFLVKPASPERLKSALEDAVKVTAKRASSAGNKPDLRQISQSMVARSEEMERVSMLMRKAAASDIPVLIEGESGVGKELIARAIQSGSTRRRKPFIVVNCGAIPENLIESILFGHEKGAFTGATEKHTGKFVEANGGTLFLDEIGELPLEAQVKLLRAIQEGEVEPVGGKGVRKVDIRVISATNRDLIAAIKEGKFREDLFYRLNVFPIMVPPLRKRASDIPHLTAHFIDSFRRTEPSFTARGISQKALALLESHDWPGNIRQLQNAIFRAMVLCEGDRLEEADFPQIVAQVRGIDLEKTPELAGHAAETPPPMFHDPESDQDASSGGRIPAGLEASALYLLTDEGHVRPLDELESETIAYAIEHYRGQMSEVARRLGIGRSTLYRKIKEYDLLGTEA